VTTARLFDLLAHPIALDAMQSLSRGASPKGVLAGIAGDLVAAKVAEALGGAAPVRAAAPKAERVDDDGIIDAEFKVINVTPRASKTKEK
jgi:hypothetical protein